MLVHFLVSMFYIALEYNKIYYLALIICNNKWEFWVFAALNSLCMPHRDCLMKIIFDSNTDGSKSMSSHKNQRQCHQKSRTACIFELPYHAASISQHNFCIYYAAYYPITHLLYMRMSNRDLQQRKMLQWMMNASHESQSMALTHACYLCHPITCLNDTYFHFTIKSEALLSSVVRCAHNEHTVLVWEVLTKCWGLRKKGIWFILSVRQVFIRGRVRKRPWQ